MDQTQATTGTIAGYFENRSDAERALDTLQEAGFTSAHVGVAHSTEHHGNTASGAAHKAGEKAEGMWDKVKNFFEGGVEPYADEKTRGDLASREITTTDDGYNNQYSGYHDDFHENLNGLDVPEDRSRYLSHRFNSGHDGAVVTVNAGPRAAEAEDILRRYGADLGENAANYDDKTPATVDTTTARSTTDTGTEQVQEPRRIQLLGELLRVHKERVNRGEVRIRKEVVTENQTIQVPVTREELVIERHAVDGNTPVNDSIGSGEEIRIPLTEETAALDRSTVVREEVAVGKKAVSGTRDLSGEVRREELVVDDQTDNKAVNR